MIGSAKTGWWPSDFDPYWRRLIIADILDADREEMADANRWVICGDPRAEPPRGILEVRGVPR